MSVPPLLPCPIPLYAGADLDFDPHTDFPMELVSGWLQVVLGVLGHGLGKLWSG
jgi:hypothetical protein